MVVRRIKDRWHNSTPENPKRDIQDEKSLDDQASAMAFIIWRLALNGAINLHGEDFRYDDDHERIGVISEWVAFQIQLVDRRSYTFLDNTQRQVFINALCQKVADLVQDNLEEIAGPGNYRQPFVALLNDRFQDYAQFRFVDDKPGYDALRYFGRQILEILGEDQTNRWVMDHVMEIDAPELISQVVKSLDRLFGR